eukprot:TRINITY_DN45706_c0_g1_i1.p1 TRINITY_DN45706_c0_g1~~TRINITY_DN45706_c0_g1_i1.p1  ORF type:complete len:342 (+),score=86.59 TRINITY_DN45706_c0_g1_i1:61-1086(+)
MWSSDGGWGSGAWNSWGKAQKATVIMPAGAAKAAATSTWGQTQQAKVVVPPKGAGKGAQGGVVLPAQKAGGSYYRAETPKAVGAVGGKGKANFDYGKANKGGGWKATETPAALPQPVTVGLIGPKPAKLASTTARSTPYGDASAPKAAGRQQPPQKEASEEVQPCYVHVSGLPDTAKWQDLKEHMQSAGTVEFARVMKNTGYVQYAAEEAAKKAIATLNGSKFGGQAIVVEEWRGPEPDTLPAGASNLLAVLGAMMSFQEPSWKKVQGDPAHMVYVGSISDAIDSKDLKVHMEQVGEVKELAHRGNYAQVLYSSEIDASNAIAVLNGSDLSGVSIVVDKWT